MGITKIAAVGWGASTADVALCERAGLNTPARSNTCARNVKPSGMCEIAALARFPHCAEGRADAGAAQETHTQQPQRTKQSP